MSGTKVGSELGSERENPEEVVDLTSGILDGFREAGIPEGRGRNLDPLARCTS